MPAMFACTHLQRPASQELGMLRLFCRYWSSTVLQLGFCLLCSAAVCRRCGWRLGLLRCFSLCISVKGRADSDLLCRAGAVGAGCGRCCLSAAEPSRAAAAAAGGTAAVECVAGGTGSSSSDRCACLAACLIAPLYGNLNLLGTSGPAKLAQQHSAVLHWCKQTCIQPCHPTSRCPCACIDRHTTV